MILHRHDLGWLIPFLSWLGLSIRLFTLHVSIEPLTQARSRLWSYAIKRHTDKLCPTAKFIAGVVITVAMILAATFASAETPQSRRSDRAVGLFGLVVFLGGFYATSRDRKNINFQAVIVAVFMQFLLAIFVLRTQAGVCSHFSSWSPS